METLKSNENEDEEEGEMYLCSRHALRGATLQEHLLLHSHLPPQRLLLKVLPQVYRGRHRCSQLVKLAVLQQRHPVYLGDIGCQTHTHTLFDMAESFFCSA